MPAPQGRKGFPVWLLKILFCFRGALNLTAMLAQHECPYIKNHVILFHKSRKPGIQTAFSFGWWETHWRLFPSFPSHDQNEMFSHQAFRVLEFNYKTLPFSLLGWLPHPRNSDKKDSLYSQAPSFKAINHWLWMEWNSLIQTKPERHLLACY